MRRRGPALSMAATATMVALAMVAMLAGCAQTPTQSEAAQANVAVPAQWQAKEGVADAGAANAAPDVSGWWRKFGDPMLDRLIDEALEAAPDVRSARARLRQARAARSLAVANLFPSVGASASATRSTAGTAIGGSGQAQTLYAAGFDASWEPSIFGGLRDAADAAAADAAASAATLESTRVSLAAEVAFDYVSLRAYQLRLAIARANAASQAETLQIAEWRQQAGLATTLDVEQARTNLEQSRASIPSLDIGRAEAEHALALLTGKAPGALQATLQEAKPLPMAPEEVAVGIPADTLRQRPDVHAAELALRAEVARTAEQRAALYPSLTLSGSWGWKAFSAAALGGGDTLVRSLAAGLAGTLFDGGRIRARIEVQDAVQEQTLIAYEKSILTALQDVENALVAYAAGRERVDTRRRAAAAARNAAWLAHAKYQAGLVDFQTVLDTDRTRLAAEDNLATSESDVLTATISLYKALGGGWRPMPESAESPEQVEGRP